MPTTYWLKFGNTPLGYNGNALKTEYTAPGSLSISCSASISGSGFDTTKQFGCTVTFNAVVPYTLDGVAQTPASSVHLLLVKDQTAVLGGIPAGTSYSITEDPISPADQELGYSNGAVTGATGAIAEDTTSAAALGYAYVAPPGDITVTCSCSGVEADPYYEMGRVHFRFSPAVRYSVNGVRISQPSNYLLVKLKSGESVVVGDIPDGTTYHVESGTDGRPDPQVPGYSGPSEGYALASGIMGPGAHVAATCTYTFTMPAAAVVFEFGSSSYNPKTTLPSEYTTGSRYIWYQLSSSPNRWMCCDSSSNDTSFTDKFYSRSVSSDLFASAGGVDIIWADFTGKTSTSYMFADTSVKSVGRWYNTSALTASSNEDASMSSMFRNTLITAIPSAMPAPTGKWSYVDYMFDGCTAVASGIISYYNKLVAAKGSNRWEITGCFRDCGSGTTSGAAELAQIPSDWK